MSEMKMFIDTSIEVFGYCKRKHVMAISLQGQVFQKLFEFLSANFCMKVFHRTKGDVVLRKPIFGLEFFHPETSQFLAKVEFRIDLKLQEINVRQFEKFSEKQKKL